MKKRMRLLGIMSVLMVLLCFGTVDVYAEDILTPVEGGSGSITYSLEPGQTVHVSVPVRAIYNEAYVYSIDAKTESSLISIANVAVVDANGKEINISNGTWFGRNTNSKIEMDLTADRALKAGSNSISVTGTGYYYDGSETEAETVKSLSLITIQTKTSTELVPPYLVVTDTSYSKANMIQGGSADVKFTIRNDGEINALKAYISVDFGDTGIEPDYSVSRTKLGDVAANSSINFTVPVKVSETATAGKKSVTVTLSCRDASGTEISPVSYTVYINVKENTAKVDEPVLKVTTKQNYAVISREQVVKIPLIIKNKGDAIAKNIKISAVSGLGSDSGITKNYTGDYVNGGSIKKSDSKEIEIPVIVSEKAEAGLKEFVFKVSYTDKDGNAKEDVSITIYRILEVEAASYNLEVSDVSQNVSHPAAGDEFTLSFIVKNTGTEQLTDVRVTGQNFSSATFVPVSGDPYVRVGNLSAGETKKVSIRLICGDSVPSGANAVTFNIDYLNSAGTKVTEAVSVYVLNVEGKGNSTGRPKIIVSNYGTDEDVLKAGSTFNFNFTLKNTHTSKPAKNIKVTLSQKDAVFAPSAGTNSFYIEEIKAGEEIVEELEMKVKNTAATGDYDLSVSVDYEYDNMSEQELEKGGVTEENLIKLHATENYRPVIENVAVGGWDGSVYVNEPTDLSFEFYNMGQSKLGNVFVTVEGDFELANNANMTYVGAIDAYGQQVVNPQVVALTEGDATGTLVVHFEDSNGDEITTSQDFTAFVSTMEFDGIDDYVPEIPDGYTMNEYGEIVPIDQGLPVWAWIAIIAGIAVVVIVIVVIVVKVAKNKKKKSAASEYEDEDSDDDNGDEDY
mgnify:CR=1 FL=1